MGQSGLQRNHICSGDHSEATGDLSGLRLAAVVLGKPWHDQANQFHPVFQPLGEELIMMDCNPNSPTLRCFLDEHMQEVGSWWRVGTEPGNIKLDWMHRQKSRLPGRGIAVIWADKVCMWVPTQRYGIPRELCARCTAYQGLYKR